MYFVGYINMKMSLRESELACQFACAWVIHLLCGDAFSLCSLKFRRLNSKSALARAQLALKGNGGLDSDWFYCTLRLKNTPITH